MRLGLWGLAALVLGALIAQLLLQDRGYVLIDFRGYAVEMSVPGLLLAWAAVYALVRAVAAVWRVPGRLGRRFGDRKIRRAGGRLTQALLRMAEGDWAKGERLLTQGLNGSQAPLAHYLLAARAAQVQGSASRRDEWLKIAYEEMPEAETAILLTRAELQLEGGDHERAFATLRRIERRSPRHPQVLAMLARACSALEDHGRLVELLPRVAKRARIEPELLLRLVRPALEAQFAGPEVTRAELDAYWAKLPGSFRKIAGAIVLRARLLERLGHGEQAEKELRAALKRQWQAPLVIAYGEVRGKDLAKQLRYAEGLLKEHPEDPALLATTARLCIEAELWGKARSYLESSLALEPDPARFALYGRLLDRLGDGERAALAFRSGLALLEHAPANLPALIAPASSPALRLAGGA